MPSFVEKWLKNATLEVQEYDRLVVAGGRCVVSRPLYRHDLVEQFDALGVASLTLMRWPNQRERCVTAQP